METVVVAGDWEKTHGREKEIERWRSVNGKMIREQIERETKELQTRGKRTGKEEGKIKN